MASKIGRKVFSFFTNDQNILHSINFNLGATKAARVTKLTLTSDVTYTNIAQAAWLESPYMQFQLQRSDPGYLLAPSHNDYIDSVRLMENNVVYDPVAATFRYSMRHEEQSLSDNGILLPDRLFVGFSSGATPFGFVSCTIDYTVVNISDIEKIALSA